MDRDEIKRRMENIREQLGSTNEDYHGAAITAFNNLIKSEKVPNSQLKDIIPPIKKTIMEPDSSLRTDFFKAASSIGIKDFSLIEDFFDSMAHELDKKNRFRTKIIVEMLIKLRNSKNQSVQDAIEKVIKEAPKLFDESYLIPILQSFWESSLEKNFQFLEKYHDLIENHIQDYPDRFKDIKSYINDRFEDYRKYKKELKEQRRKEAKKRRKMKEKERKRKERKKRRNERRRRELLEKKEVERTEIVEALEKQTKKDETPPREISEGMTEGEFATFTNLGLKRKEPEEDDS
ncbi:MAG: hypothetical protein ACOC4M_11900 [Promethearchaeia archaeon]